MSYDPDENIVEYKLNEKTFITYKEQNIIHRNMDEAKEHMESLYNDSNYKHLFKNTVYIYILSEDKNDTENVFKHSVQYDNNKLEIQKMVLNTGLIKITTIQPYIFYKEPVTVIVPEEYPYSQQLGGSLDNSNKLNDILNKILDKHYGNEINNCKINITLPSRKLVEMVINDQYTDDCATLIIEYIINIEEVFKLIKKIFNDDFIPKILKDYILAKNIIIITLTKIYFYDNNYDYDLFFTKLVDLIFPWLEHYL
jgi:hypothetical protein